MTIRIAFVEQSIERGRFLVMSAVVVNAADQKPLAADLLAQGLFGFRASRAGERRRSSMEALLRQPPVQRAVSVCAMIMRTPELARTQCLGTLATRLGGECEVDYLVLPWRGGYEMEDLAQRGKAVRDDMAVIQHAGCDELVEVQYADALPQPIFGLADVVSWRTRSALAKADIQDSLEEFTPIAPFVELLDANYGFGREETILQAHFDLFRATCRERTSHLYMTDGQAGVLIEYTKTLLTRIVSNVRHGAPDWSYFFSNPGEAEHPALGARSVWHDFQGLCEDEIIW